MISFTHHSHFLDIARAVCPEARIRRLDTDAGGAAVPMAV